MTPRRSLQSRAPSRSVDFLGTPMKHEQQPSEGAVSNAELAELLGRLQVHHDITALTAIVEKTHLCLFRIAYGFVRDRNRAEDLTSEVFSVFVKRYPTIRDRTRLLSWLHGVALKCARKYRTNNQEVLVPGELLREIAEHRLEIDPPLAYRSADLSDLSKALTRAIANLPARYQQCIALLYLDGRPPKEVARIMGVSVESIHTYRCRALEQLSNNKDLREWL